MFRKCDNVAFNAHAKLKRNRKKTNHISGVDHLPDERDSLNTSKCIAQAQQFNTFFSFFVWSKNANCVSNLQAKYFQAKSSPRSTQK